MGQFLIKERSFKLVCSVLNNKAGQQSGVYIEKEGGRGPSMAGGID